MTKFFKPEDFHNQPNFHTTSLELAGRIATTANEKLEREGLRVNGILGKVWAQIHPSDGWKEINFNQERSTHKALLINIEQIEECKHPNNKIELVNCRYYECECGVKVKPTSFEEIK